jgi:hypothetical protein
VRTRRDIAAARRRAKHRTLVGSATTATKRLWRACNWLIATAKARGQLAEALAAVLDLIDRLDAGEQLTGTEPAPAQQTPAGPHRPWYMQVRAAAGERNGDVA